MDFLALFLQGSVATNEVKEVHLWKLWREADSPKSGIMIVNNPRMVAYLKTPPNVVNGEVSL